MRLLPFHVFACVHGLNKQNCASTAKVGSGGYSVHVLYLTTRNASVNSPLRTTVCSTGLYRQATYEWK